MFSWPLQVDTQTEENDMNKRRRQGFNNLEEVCVLGLSSFKDPCPEDRWLGCAWLCH